MLFKNDRTELHISGWAMFWVFMIVYLFVDTLLFTRGYETFFWRHITSEEKQIQQIKIDLMRKEASND